MVEWEEPALFTRALGNFNSLTTLWIFETETSDGLPDHISCGEFSKRITALCLYSLRCTISTVISTSLSLPNLNSLTIEDYGTLGGERPPTCSATLQTGPLDFLRLSGHVDGAAETLIGLRFVSRRFFLDVQVSCLQNFLVLSSETVTELEGVWPLLICLQITEAIK